MAGIIFFIFLSLWLIYRGNNVIPPSTALPSPTPLPSLAPTTIPTDVPTPTMKTATPRPTAAPTLTPSNKPTAQPQANLDSLHYQPSTAVQSTDTRLELTSADDPAVITDWYKSKLQALGYQSRSFITTSTNGKVINKLVVTGHGSTITVDITKEPGASQTHIIVTIS